MILTQTPKYFNSKHSITMDPFIDSMKSINKQPLLMIEDDKTKIIDQADRKIISNYDNNIHKISSLLCESCDDMILDESNNNKRKVDIEFVSCKRIKI